MALKSYYRDRKGNPYTVIDEYIITDEDLPIFRSVIPELAKTEAEAVDEDDEEDATKVAFICWRFCLLYADMLQLRYEHLTDVFTIINPSDARWKAEGSAYSLKSEPPEIRDSEKEPTSLPPTGFEWTFDMGLNKWVIIRQKDTDLEFKIKVLESDARLLNAKVRGNLEVAATWVLGQTQPDLTPKVEEALGVGASGSTPETLLAAAARSIRLVRNLISKRYVKQVRQATPVNTAVEELVVVTALNAPPEAKADFRAAQAEEAAEAAEAAAAAAAAPAVAVAPAPAPAALGGRRSYRRGLSKLI